MLLETKWIFFHCIRRKLPLRGMYSTEYECEKIDNILDAKLPKMGSEEYLVPICGYIPKTWIPYYLNKYISNLIKIQVVSKDKQ